MTEMQMTAVEQVVEELMQKEGVGIFHSFESPWDKITAWFSIIHATQEEGVDQRFDIVILPGGELHFITSVRMTSDGPPHEGWYPIDDETINSCHRNRSLMAIQEWTGRKMRSGNAAVAA